MHAVRLEPGDAQLAYQAIVRLEFSDPGLGRRLTSEHRRFFLGEPRNALIVATDERSRWASFSPTFWTERTVTRK